MTQTSLGVMWTAVPGWFTADTRGVLNMPHRQRFIELGHPWIDSPIFDRLAGERFGSDGPQ